MRPDYLPALYNLGLVLHESGRFDEAEACFRRLLALDPADVDSLFHLGALCQRNGRTAEAAETYRVALRHAPENVHLWMRLGEVGIAQFSERSLRDAADCFRRALRLQPDFADAHFNLGYVRSLDGRHDEALAGFQAALRLRPDMVAFQSSLLGEMQRICDWSRFDELCALQRRSSLERSEPPVYPFSLISISPAPAEQLACAKNFARSLSVRVTGDGAHPRVRSAQSAGKRRRIGYLSAEFHEHATAYLTAELFELHDRSRFEIVAYSYGPDDRSAIRARLRRSFDRFVDLRLLPPEQSAAVIHSDGVEILVDLKGFTVHARPEIAALRPAPVQVSYLGYPGTMGADYIDYLVGDRFVTPVERAGEYTEKLVLMPDSYQVNDRRRPVAETPARAALGLPESGFVFCCFNQAYKILPEVFSLWMRMLDAVPGSVLWLLEWNPWAAQNLRREAAARNIDPARLILAPLLPLPEHLGRLAGADLFLDTFPYNAHTTASDALWAGLPLLTCAGETFASRVAGSLLKAVGMPELITHTLADYEALGVRLARAPREHAGLRNRLSRNRASAPLFDTPRFTRHLEVAYEKMWEIHRAGSAPRLIEL